MEPAAPLPEPDDEADDVDDSETVLSLGPIAAPGEGVCSSDRIRRPRPKQTPRDFDFD